MKYVALVLGAITSVLALLFSREKSQRESLEKEVQSHDLKQEQSDAVEEIKANKPVVEVDNNNGRYGIGGGMHNNKDELR